MAGADADAANAAAIEACAVGNKRTSELEAALAEAVEGRSKAEATIQRWQKKCEEAEVGSLASDKRARQLRDAVESSASEAETARIEAAAQRERADKASGALSSTWQKAVDAVNSVGAAQGALRTAISKLVTAQEAMEGELTCMKCMELLHEPAGL